MILYHLEVQMQLVIKMQNPDAMRCPLQSSESHVSNHLLLPQVGPHLLPLAQLLRPPRPPGPAPRPLRPRQVPPQPPPPSALPRELVCSSRTRRLEYLWRAILGASRWS